MLRRLSLTSRLTAFFTVVAAVVVLGLGWLFLALADQHFAELDRVTLQDKRQLIEEVLANANSAEDAKWRLNESLDHHHGLFASVASASGETLFRSQGFAASPQIQPSSTGSDNDAMLQMWAPDGRELRALRFSVNPKYESTTILDVTIAMDTAHHAQFLAELRMRLMLYAIAATLISGFLGWLAAHHGLSPLHSMRARAAGVSGQQLSERMPVDAVPVEMAELARELNRMLDRLQSDFMRLQDFSSDLAHELRTPISNLLTQTQVTLSNARDAVVYRDILASNAEELQRLARMVSDMLFLAKTERGVNLPHRESFFARHEVQALLEFYEAVAEEKNIRLSAEGDGEILGDQLMFRRAISNLLSNALRHAPEGGEVHVIIANSGQSTEVTVENTGQDIDPQALPRLFDRFFRADPARSRSASDGAGLGLSITKAIAEAHGGTASASSLNGRTRFKLTFPRSE